MDFVNLDQPIISLSQFDILELIGQSSDHSCVYKALDKKSGRIVAIKIISIVDQKDVNTLIATLLQQQRPWKHICQLLYCFGEEGKVFIVMEYFAGGSIKDILHLLKQDDQILDFEVTQVILKQIVLAVDEIHSHQLVHRNIKLFFQAANTLLSSDGQIKLSYFSPNQQFQETLHKSKSHLVSLPYWLPPETIKTSAFDQKGDIWSIGITAFELITGQIPYEGILPQKAIFIIVCDTPPRLPSHYPNFLRQLQDFVERCLQKDPKNRSEAKDLLLHPLIRDIKKVGLLCELFEKSSRMKSQNMQKSTLAQVENEGTDQIHTNQQQYMHKRVRTSFRVNSKGILVLEMGHSRGDSKQSNEQVSPQTLSQGNSLTQTNFVQLGVGRILEEESEQSEPHRHTTTPLAKIEDGDIGQAFLMIKRTIRKLEKYKPGLTKIIFQEIIQSYKDLDPSDYKVFF